MRAYVRSALEDPSLLSPPPPGGGTSEELPDDDVEVVEAVSGLDALRLLPRGRFDLVITDINMPDINGLELIRFVRQSERYEELAMLIISTQASERDIERGLALGADGFLPKPFTHQALRDAARASLQKRQGRAAAGGARAGRGSEVRG